VTTVTTLTTCPAMGTCSGQKTTWTGSQGPYSCTKTPSCVAQLPGGGTTTITVCSSPFNMCEARLRAD
jgi:hypothetical protein